MFVSSPFRFSNAAGLRDRRLLLVAVLVTLLPGMPSMTNAAEPAANPLLAPWTGPYGGVPPFDRVRVADFEPALEAGMAGQLARIDAIAGNPEPPTFANTTAEIERAGRIFERVRAVYDVFGSDLNDDAMQEVERRMAPRLAAFADKIVQNEKLFARVAAVYEARERSGLTPEQQRLAWLHYTDLVRAGAKLDAAAKQRLAAINEELAGLFTAFAQNVLKDEESQAVLLAAEADLAGCPEAGREAAAEAAKERGPGGFAIVNARSSVSPSSPTPTVATCGSGCGGCSWAAARRAAPPTTMPRSPGCWRSAPSGRSCWASRRTPTGGSRTRWPRRPSGRSN